MNFRECIFLEVILLRKPPRELNSLGGFISASSGNFFSYDTPRRLEVGLMVYLATEGNNA
jgi:hypothetical protein